MAKVLVTGGAGYVGSHAVRELRRAGHDVVVFDSLEQGHAAAVREARLVVGRLADRHSLRDLLRAERVETVLHFAALISAGESCTDPGRYFEHNAGGTLSLLRAMAEAGVRRLVFSSTAAVYGEPERCPVPEDARLAPVNPYGWSKLWCEQMLPAFAGAHGLRWVALRYFNAAGADPDGNLGEDHCPETHLIPRVLRTALAGGGPVEVYGADYATPDGTCVRDYVHVSDLALAHVLAMDALDRGLEAAAYNVGVGRGYSVRDVVESARRVTGQPLPERVLPRRPGDPAVLVADAARIRRELGWEPRFPDLETMTATAWAWFRAHPDGYGPEASPRAG